MTKSPMSPEVSKYTNSVNRKIVQRWMPIPSELFVRIRLSFQLQKNGSVSNIKVLNPGMDTANEVRAIAAIRASSPFAPLPANCSEPMSMSLLLERSPSLKLSVSQSVAKYGPSARKVLRERSRIAGLAYPPQRLTLIGLKDERLLLLFGGSESKMKLLGSFPLVSFSGKLGPKLREGDLQIPEGIYKATNLQTNGLLALGINYPNESDRANASIEHRSNLGGDILIHGGSQSTGCLVISNEAMKQVFIAVNDVQCRNTKVLIAPCDLTRKEPNLDMRKQPRWLEKTYKALKKELEGYASLTEKR